MNILYLGSKNDKIIKFLIKDNNNIFLKEDKITDYDVLENIDYIISYGYRYIIEPKIVKKFYGKAINLHISFLPWNKGADPNLWSFLEDTPKGVSIHYIDYGLDTGNIIAQRLVSYNNQDTLKSTYDKLSAYIEDLFIDVWHDVKSDRVIAIQQKDKGTYHKSSDKNVYLKLLNQGWETPIDRIIGKAKNLKNRRKINK